MHPLRELLASKHHTNVTQGDVAVVFSNAETLREIHKGLCKQFEELNRKWPTEDAIGELFIQMVPYNPSE